MVAVKEIMHGTTCVSSLVTVLEVAQLMSRRNIGSVLVECEGVVCGILTERDLMTRVVARAADPQQSRAGDIMTQLKFTIDENANIFEASSVFQEHNIRRLPVTRAGKIVGIITARDVARSMPYAISARMTRMHTADKSQQIDY
jgi:signal-transduction protein with cAMP-binding, CBS, and nucleotidyltransferase domain